MFGRITSDAKILGGKPIIQGTRISVAMILEWFASGATTAEIVRKHPQLREEDVGQALAYAAASICKVETDNCDEYDPSWITGKALDRHFLMQEALFEFSRLFRDEENDRALGIVGGAFLDSLLENILIEFMVDDEKEVDGLLRYDQPMGTYSGRIRAAYCLGLLRKTVRDDLRLVGKIRNMFAHDLSASFSAEPIRTWCNSLRWHRESYMQPPVDASARDLFHVGVNQLVCHLNGYVSIARGEKRMLPKGY